MENGKFCIEVGPVTWFVDVPSYSWLKVLAVNGAGHPVNLGHMSLVSCPADPELVHHYIDHKSTIEIWNTVRSTESIEGEG